MSDLELTLPLQPCAECGRPLDPLDRETRHGITGWIQRRPRGTGGVHHVELMAETGQLMHEHCMKQLQAHRSSRQESLL